MEPAEETMALEEAEQSAPEQQAAPASEGEVAESFDSLSQKDLDFMSDVPLPAKVELGRAELRIRDLLSLQNSSVIELEKLAGEPLDFYLNQNLVAKGEVVVVNEKYGIRLTDIVRLDDSKSNT